MHHILFVCDKYVVCLYRVRYIHDRGLCDKIHCVQKKTYFLSYVNEYLISTLSEYTVPSVCSLQFLFKSTRGDKKNRSGYFF